MRVQQQRAPYPKALAEIVRTLEYRPGWRFRLVEMDRGQECGGLTFEVRSLGYNTYDPDAGETYAVRHLFAVPPAAYNRASWQRWVLERLLEIETHEACEFMQVEGRRPFAPVHAPGHDPYFVREVAQVKDVETSFRGDRDAGSQE